MSAIVWFLASKFSVLFSICQGFITIWRPGISVVTYGGVGKCSKNCLNPLWELKWTFAHTWLMLCWDCFHSWTSSLSFCISAPSLKQGLMGEGRPQEAVLEETDSSALCRGLHPCFPSFISQLPVPLHLCFPLWWWWLSLWVSWW